MKTKIGVLVLIIVLLGLFIGAKVYADDQFVVYKADLKKQDLRLYWKNGKGEKFWKYREPQTLAGEKQTDAKICHEWRNV